MRRTSILLMTAAAALLAATNAALADEPSAPQPPEPVAVAPQGNGEQLDLLQKKLAELDRLQKEVDALRAATHTPAVVVVNVELLEVSLTGMRKLGIDVAQFSDGGMRTASFVDVATRSLGADGLRVFVEGLKKINLAKTLAEPTLAMISGQPASLHVGGQFPMPAPPSSVESTKYQKFGTELDVLAETLGNDRVRLEIRSHVSELSDDDAIEVEGRKLRSLRSKQCNTTCEMSFGEILVLGGLIERRVERQVRDESDVSDQVHEIALLMVVRVDAPISSSDVAPMPQLTDLPAPSTTPPSTATRRTAPHDSIRRPYDAIRR